MPKSYRRFPLQIIENFAENYFVLVQNRTEPLIKFTSLATCLDKFQTNHARHIQNNLKTISDLQNGPKILV